MCSYDSFKSLREKVRGFSQSARQCKQVFPDTCPVKACGKLAHIKTQSVVPPQNMTRAIDHQPTKPGNDASMARFCSSVRGITHSSDSDLEIPCARTFADTWKARLCLFVPLGRVVVGAESRLQSRPRPP